MGILKTMIIISISSGSIMTYAMKENTERSLKNTWHKLDVIAGKIKRSVSYEDFLVAQCDEAQNLLDYYIDMLPDGLGDQIIEQLKAEKEIVQHRQIVAAHLNGHYYVLRLSS